MSKHSALAAMVWSAAAVLGVGAGMAAISAVGTGITERGVKPMTPGEVNAALAVPATPPGPPPSASAPASPPPRDPPRPAPTVTVTRQVTAAITNLASEAGDIVARCDRGTAFLVSWTPAQNFSVGASNRTPPGAVFVRFQSSARFVTMTVTCRADRPSAAVSVDRRDGEPRFPYPHRHFPGRG
ncbi:hypothetical protein GCM10009527_047940 [Actinomadura nitritigenes]|uniref:Uncharacterized protein n=1 Tax=Actinomadura nitritigenes TaxID=134602 RepID=A0ABS3QTL2_9ACTN|nr:hypothetical protein [Actinomadura nitritigenes]MBO2437321.1 hypothetical protein [Actinomadura nitritigenes]